MVNISDFDSSYSPLERFEMADPPNCECCGDSGMVQVGENEEDFCVCKTGHALADTFHHCGGEPCEPDYL